MGYNKIISYGNNLEVYEYEKDVVRLVGRTRTPSEDDFSDADIQLSGEDSLPAKEIPKETLGKRSDNARRASLAFRRIVASNLGGSTRPLLVTLTYRDNFTDLARAYKHLTTFIQSLRRAFGKNFKYVVVPEFQKRGAVHFHALVWGLPEEVFLHERETRTLGKLWGHGFVYLKETDGDEKLSFYLSKYMAKAFIDPRLKNQKCYVASRNIQRPLVQAGPFSIPTVLEEYGVTEEAILDRTYQTKWLGEGRYRLFKLNHDQP